MIRDGRASFGDSAINLREITRKDAGRLYRWRMDETSRPMFRSTEKVSYEVHLAFIERYFASDNRDRWFMIEAEGRPVGAIALYDLVDEGKEYEWGRILIDPGNRGLGYARRALDLLIDHCREIGVRRIRAEVLENNHASIYLHRALGFQGHDVDVADDGRRFLQLVLELEGVS